MRSTNSRSLLMNSALLRAAFCDAILKFNPKHQLKNPVMFTVLIGTLLCTGLLIHDVLCHTDPHLGFSLSVTIWLWFTLLFANFAEAIAEGRGKAQADTLKSARRDIQAKKLSDAKRTARQTLVSSADLVKGDIVLVEQGDFIPGDGEVLEGIASVNESAITGESAPVIREGGGDFSAVTGGTQVVSDWLIIRITADPGQTFLDRMISLVEGAKRQKTPNELALNILLAALTIVFLLVATTLLPYSIYTVHEMGKGDVITVIVLVALFVCLAPTTIGALLSAIGIAGMDRLIRANVIAVSGRAVEAAGDVNVLLLDKTGTITLGNRQATEFVPVGNCTLEQLALAASLSSLADETPEGRSIVLLAETKYGIPTKDKNALTGAVFVAFTAQTRMSGVDYDGRQIRKGADTAIEKYVNEFQETLSQEAHEVIHRIAKEGATPLVVAEQGRISGVICLRDIVKPGMRERFADLRRMGIKTVMITGDNPLTAAAIAVEAGVDDFLANATPEDKLALIRKLQGEGRLVAMTGDGTNDAPALAQADVAVAMNSGTQAAKEAGNMVDLDSDPTKLIEIVAIGKQLLMTRGALTTFSIANDIAKYFAILPAAFMGMYPAFRVLNVMGLTSPLSAILSAVIFNAIIIVFLIPLALKGIPYKPLSASKLLRRNALIYGVGGLIVPFIGIKLIDLFLTVCHWV